MFKLFTYKHDNYSDNLLYKPFLAFKFGKGQLPKKPNQKQKYS